MVNPLRNLGSIQVVFGGIISWASETIFNWFTVTGNNPKATAIFFLCV